MTLTVASSMTMSVDRNGSQVGPHGTGQRRRIEPGACGCASVDLDDDLGSLPENDWTRSLRSRRCRPSASWTAADPASTSSKSEPVTLMSRLEPPKIGHCRSASATVRPDRRPGSGSRSRWSGRRCRLPRSTSMVMEALFAPPPPPPMRAARGLSVEVPTTVATRSTPSSSRISASTTATCSDIESKLVPGAPVRLTDSDVRLLGGEESHRHSRQ